MKSKSNQNLKGLALISLCFSMCNYTHTKTLTHWGRSFALIKLPETDLPSPVCMFQYKLQFPGIIFWGWGGVSVTVLYLWWAFPPWMLSSRDDVENSSPSLYCFFKNVPRTLLRYLDTGWLHGAICPSLQTWKGWRAPWSVKMKTSGSSLSITSEMDRHHASLAYPRPKSRTQRSEPQNPMHKYILRSKEFWAGTQWIFPCSQAKICSRPPQVFFIFRG